MKTKILIVDDDAAVAKLLTTFLRGLGYQTVHACSADDGFAVIKRDPVDLILLDISLPGISGLQALGLIKESAETQVIPVIMLTSHNEEGLKVKGLKGGADDYVVKPFSLTELGARIEALLRRTRRNYASAADSVLESKSLSLDMDRRLVTAGERRVDLTPSEYEFLSRLMKGQGRVMTYRMLADELSDRCQELTSETVYQIVKNLRKKLGRSGNSIETVYGIGYRFAAQ